MPTNASRLITPQQQRSRPMLRQTNIGSSTTYTTGLTPINHGTPGRPPQRRQLSGKPFAGYKKTGGRPLSPDGSFVGDLKSKVHPTKAGREAGTVASPHRGRGGGGRGATQDVKNGAEPSDTDEEEEEEEEEEDPEMQRSLEVLSALQLPPLEGTGKSAVKGRRRKKHRSKKSVTIAEDDEHGGSDVDEEMEDDESEEEDDPNETEWEKFKRMQFGGKRAKKKKPKYVKGITGVDPAQQVSSDVDLSRAEESTKLKELRSVGGKGSGGLRAIRRLQAEEQRKQALEDEDRIFVETQKHETAGGVMLNIRHHLGRVDKILHVLQKNERLQGYGARSGGTAKAASNTDFGRAGEQSAEEMKSIINVLLTDMSKQTQQIQHLEQEDQKKELVIKEYREEIHILATKLSEAETEIEELNLKVIEVQEDANAMANLANSGPMSRSRKSFVSVDRSRAFSASIRSMGGSSMSSQPGKNPIFSAQESDEGDRADEENSDAGDIQHIFHFTNPHDIIKRAGVPTKNVAVVCGDVQGADTLWKQRPSEMKRVLDTYRQIVRGAAKRCGSYEVNFHVYQFMYVFQDARDAVNFSCQVQTMMLSRQWPDEFDECRDAFPELKADESPEGKHLWNGLRVKMGIDVGDPIIEVDPATEQLTYSGEIVNMALAMTRLAMGGMAVLTSAAYHLARNMHRALDDDDDDGHADDVIYGHHCSLPWVGGFIDVYRAIPTHLEERIGFFERELKEYKDKMGDRDGEEGTTELEAQIGNYRRFSHELARISNGETELKPKLLMEIAQVDPDLEPLRDAPRGECVIVYMAIDGMEQLKEGFSVAQFETLLIKPFNDIVEDCCVKYAAYTAFAPVGHHADAFPTSCDAVKFVEEVNRRVMEYRWPAAVGRCRSSEDRQWRGSTVFSGVRLKVGIFRGRPKIVFDPMVQAPVFVGRDALISGKLCISALGGQTLVSKKVADEAVLGLRPWPVSLQVGIMPLPDDDSKDPYVTVYQLVAAHLVGRVFIHRGFTSHDQAKKTAEYRVVRKKLLKEQLLMSSILPKEARPHIVDRSMWPKRTRGDTSTLITAETDLYPPEAPRSPEKQQGGAGGSPSKSTGVSPKKETSSSNLLSAVKPPEIGEAAADPMEDSITHEATAEQVAEYEAGCSILVFMSDRVWGSVGGTHDPVVNEMAKVEAQLMFLHDTYIHSEEGVYVDMCAPQVYLTLTDMRGLFSEGDGSASGPVSPQLSPRSARSGNSERLLKQSMVSARSGRSGKLGRSFEGRPPNLKLGELSAEISLRENESDAILNQQEAPANDMTEAEKFEFYRGKAASYSKLLIVLHEQQAKFFGLIREWLSGQLDAIRRRGGRAEAPGTVTDEECITKFVLSYREARKELQIDFDSQKRVSDEWKDLVAYATADVNELVEQTDVLRAGFVRDPLTVFTASIGLLCTQFTHLRTFVKRVKTRGTALDADVAGGSPTLARQASALQSGAAVQSGFAQTMASLAETTTGTGLFADLDLPVDIAAVLEQN